MTLRDRIVRWLGFEGLETRLKIEYACALDAQTQHHNQKLVDFHVEQDNRLRLVLVAATAAAEKIAKTVADRGDRTLTNYVDEQLGAFQQAFTDRN